MWRVLNHMKPIGVIGGSGFYDFLFQSEKKSVDTPFGKVDLYQGNVSGQEVVFLPRHGTDHSTPPHAINYKANIYAINKIGVQRVVSTNAVGSCQEKLKPGDFILLSSFLDLFGCGTQTFFDGSASIITQNGKKREGVVHSDMTEPYCPQLRELFQEEGRLSDVTVHNRGIYAMFRGPRFETPAEINALKSLGVNVVGMTNVPEVILAREIGLCYSTIAVITNFAAGMQSRITHEEVTEIFKKRINDLKQLIKKVIKRIPQDKTCLC